MKVLVSGGSGFIGSHLVDALVERGDDVVAVDNLSTGRRVNLESALERGARLLEEDIRDGDAMHRVFGEERPELVFHLAAQMDVRVSTARPQYDGEINVLGTINLLEAARSNDVKRFVFTSTGGAIYGESEELPATENAAIKPEAPYGQAKFAAEGYLALYRRLHGLSTVSLRLGNVYGPRQDPFGEAGVIAIFCGKLLEGGRPTVFGDGRQTRDYIYVRDVVDAALTVAGNDLSGAYNVGRGVETSVLELVETLAELGRESDGISDEASAAFEPQFDPPRPGEVLRNALDPSLSREVLGFEAKVGVRDGLRTTLESFRTEAERVAR
jgi:UDP-glucose 4-epimerase